MKRFIPLAVVISLCSFTLTPGEPLPSGDLGESENDKTFLLNYFQETFDRLQTLTQGLSREQLHFKPAEDRWSISQCLEHIVLTERALLDNVKELGERPANPERKGEVEITDSDLVAGLTDRSSKAQAPESLQPEGNYKNPKRAIRDLKKERKQITALLDNNSEEDLRNRVSDSFLGAMDLYQSFLFIAAHTARHTAQIEEVKNLEDFPQ